MQRRRRSSRGRKADAVVAPLALLLVGAAPARDAVDYTLAPELRDGAIVALDVTLRLHGDASGTTTVDWGDSWAGEEHLGRWARDITVDGARSAESAPHGGRVIRAAPGAPLTIRYRIVSAFAGDPGVADSEQPRPVVRPTWFYAVGEALFATPLGRDAAPVRFRWAGAPGIGFASDLEHDRARPGARGKTVDDVAESVVIGGRDLRVTRTEAGGAPLRVATVGRYAFDLPTFERLAGAVVAAERRFWGEADHQPFLVTMTPVTAAPGHVSFSGTGRGDAFALWMDTGADVSNLGWLLAHEYFHTWNYRRLGTLGDDEARSYWMSEGFTDFYARRLLLRAGLIAPAAFAANWNEMFAAYAASPYRTAPAAKAAADHWRDRAAEKLPYQRGAMLAALWDARLRETGRGTLDDVLRDQRRRRARITSAAPVITTLFATVAASHGLDVGPDVGRYVERGEPLALPPGTFGRCARVETITRPVFARGYDAGATSRTGTVSGVDPASPAYAAGLRDGMRLLRRTAGLPGDSRVDYTLVVSDAGTERTITFRPAGTATETLQQLALDRAAFAADPQGCAAALAG